MLLLSGELQAQGYSHDQTASYSQRGAQKMRLQMA